MHVFFDGDGAGRGPVVVGRRTARARHGPGNLAFGTATVLCWHLLPAWTQSQRRQRWPRRKLQHGTPSSTELAKTLSGERGGIGRGIALVQVSPVWSLTASSDRRNAVEEGRKNM